MIFIVIICCYNYTIDNINGEISYYKNDLFKVVLDYEITIPNLTEEPIKVNSIIDSYVKYNGLIIQTYNIEPKPVTSETINN